jgi:hypothetical protein
MPQQPRSRNQKKRNQTKKDISQFWNGMVKWIQKNRTYSLGGLLKGLSRQFISVAIIYLGFFASIFFRTPLGQPLDTNQLWWAGIISICIQILSFIKDRIILSKKEKEVNAFRTTIYNCFAGAIEQLGRIRKEPMAQRNQFITEILKHIEKVVFTTLRDEDVLTGDLCVNYMRYFPDTKRLKLERFGNFVKGRTYRELEVDENCPDPGAPNAAIKKKVVYIDDTQSSIYSDYFHETTPYRSIISTPLKDTNGNVFGIINIDSDRPNQFVDQEFITERIIPVINPLTSLLELEKSNLIPDPRPTNVKNSMGGNNA